MKLGIMQPYFMPYIGYWQLMNAVDKYVIYDDVNFIKGGWINRNRILVNGEPRYFNLPMLGASSNKLINEIKVNNNPVLIAKNLRILEGAYQKAPYYECICQLMSEIMNCQQDSLGLYIFESFKIICNYLDINTELILSSDLSKNCDLKGQEKVLAICSELGATEYYNAIGGQELYSYEEFEKNNIKLKFLNTSDVTYHQFDNDFQSNLSIIDVMMFNSREKIKEMLKMYSLIENEKDTCEINI